MPQTWGTAAGPPHGAFVCFILSCRRSLCPIADIWQPCENSLCKPALLAKPWRLGYHPKGIGSNPSTSKDKAICNQALQQKYVQENNAKI